MLPDNDASLATGGQQAPEASTNPHFVTAEKPGESSRLVPAIEAKHGGVEIIDQLAPEWRLLCQESSADEPYFQPEWIAAYARAYLPPGTLLLLIARTGRKLSAVLPLMKGGVNVSGIPLRRLRGAYRPYTSRFDLTRCSGPAGDAAVNAFWTFLRDFPDWDVLEFPDVPQGGALEELQRLAQADGCPVGRVRSMNSPYVSLSGWDGHEDYFLRGLDSRFVSTFRRRKRRLTEQGSLTLRGFRDAEPGLLHIFFNLEASGWKGHQGSAIGNDQRYRQFYEAVARSAARFGYLRLHFLEHRGKMIAGHFGLTYRHRHSTPKGARDEEYDRFGPGHLLMDLVLRECAQQGLQEFDFLCEDDPWKLSWTSQVRPHANLYIFRKNPQGRLAHLGRFKFKPVLRAILGRNKPAR